MSLALRTPPRVAPEPAARFAPLGACAIHQALSARRGAGVLGLDIDSMHEARASQRRRTEDADG